MKSIDYDEFVRKKLAMQSCEGIDADISGYGLYPHQRDLTAWSLRRGRAAIFADTGLGKSRMQLAWADSVCKSTGGDVLILAPLAVADQTRGEGLSIGVEVTRAHDQSDVKPGITITNYDRLHRFDASSFSGVVLDESSIIKHHTAKTLQTLLESFRATPYKLCATATPSPNDWTELGNHAEFLGVCARTEMLAEYFVHDGGDTQTWRLKGHARHVFWKWVASWGAMIRSPADLGHDASAYNLPPLHVHQHVIDVDHDPALGLFAMEAQTLTERRDARKSSMSMRVAECVATVNAHDHSLPWLIWCDLNAEQDALRAAFDGRALSVQGSDHEDHKERAIHAWIAGERPIMISKPSIMGFGLNFQHCANMAFVGVADSFEKYYQAVRRCWRFGQKRDVHVHVFSSSLEGAVVANLKRKEMDAKIMADAMAIETIDAVRSSVTGRTKQTNTYQPHLPIVIPSFARAS